MAGKFGYLNETKFRARDINFRLIVYVLLLSTIGVFVVHSATASEVTRTIVSTTVKQVIGVGMGLVAMIILAFIDYRKIVKYSWILLLISTLFYKGDLRRAQMDLCALFRDDPAFGVFEAGASCISCLCAVQNP